MEKNKKMTQKELMKKFLEDKKNKEVKGITKSLRPEKSSSKSISKVKRSHNGGGFFDK